MIVLIRRNKDLTINLYLDLPEYGLGVSMVVVSETYLDLPEYGPGVSVVIVSERDVLVALAALQECLHVLEKPRLVPQADRVHLGSHRVWIRNNA